MRKSTLPALLLAFSTVFAFSSCDDDEVEVVPPVPNQSFTHELDNINSATTAGWVFTNKSAPAGTSNWATGPGAAAFSGAGFITSDYNATAGAGIISNWAISPVITLQNGDRIEFYAISANDNADPANVYPDRLQVLMSKEEAISIGTGDSRGNFTTLIDINSTYDNMPPVAFPDRWTKFVATVAGLNGPTKGRFAFRYYVEDGGPSGTNSAAIGIDKVSYIGQ